MNKYIIALVCLLGIGVVLGAFQLIGGLMMEVYYSSGGVYFENIILGIIAITVCLIAVGYLLEWGRNKK